MINQGRPELVITAQHLNKTRRENLLSELNNLERRVRCERRRLDDDGTSSEDSGKDLSHRQQDGKVPGTDSRYDPQRNEPCRNGLLVVLVFFLLRL
jgi:hypothetical protein